MNTKKLVNESIDHLFRREGGRIVAHLTRYLGTSNLDLAENLFQEALTKAVQNWPLNGIPENPGAWVMQVSKNLAIDHIRSQKFLVDNNDKLDLTELPDPRSSDAATFENEIQDDLLKLIFVCCHPLLSKEAQAALTLKTVCSFSVVEIAKAFLSNEETIFQRIVRAKKKIAESQLKYEVPSPRELRDRLSSVLEVLYLLFNEGYSATLGTSTIRNELCEEAIQKTQILAQHPLCNSPEVHALLALMYFQSSRFNSRLDSNGELLLLDEQDRSLWDQQRIHMGAMHLEMSAAGSELTEYHLQAGIAFCHATAASFEATDWTRILNYYDLLLEKNPTPIVVLNRAVAIAMVLGPEVGLEEAETLSKSDLLKKYYLLPATKAELYRRLGDMPRARALYQEALTLVGTEPERRLIERKLRSCN